MLCVNITNRRAVFWTHSSAGGSYFTVSPVILTCIILTLDLLFVLQSCSHVIIKCFHLISLLCSPESSSHLTFIFPQVTVLRQTLNIWLFSSKYFHHKHCWFDEAFVGHADSFVFAVELIYGCFFHLLLSLLTHRWIIQLLLLRETSQLLPDVQCSPEKQHVRLLHPCLFNQLCLTPTRMVVNSHNATLLHHVFWLETFGMT